MNAHQRVYRFASRLRGASLVPVGLLWADWAYTLRQAQARRLPPLLFQTWLGRGQCWSWGEIVWPLPQPVEPPGYRQLTARRC